MKLDQFINEILLAKPDIDEFPTSGFDSHIGIITNDPFYARVCAIPELIREAILERVAIMEFDGGLPRNEAEGWIMARYKSHYAGQTGELKNEL